MMRVKPLRIGVDHWRSRWLVTNRWRALHRVSSIKWEKYGFDPGQKVRGDGVTVCGIKGHLQMPGIASRMSLKRCDRCCRALKIPFGIGAPFNDVNLSQKDRNA